MESLVAHLDAKLDKLYQPEVAAEEMFEGIWLVMSTPLCLHVCTAT